MNNIDESIKEIDRAITELGLKGVQIHTDINGVALDVSEFLPILIRWRNMTCPCGCIRLGAISSLIIF